MSTHTLVIPDWFRAFQEYIGHLQLILDCHNVYISTLCGTGTSIRVLWQRVDPNEMYAPGTQPFIRICTVCYDIIELQRKMKIRTFDPPIYTTDIPDCIVYSLMENSIGLKSSGGSRGVRGVRSSPLPAPFLNIL